MIKIKNYSKIRYVLFGLLSIFLIYVIYNYGIATLAVLALIIGTLSFVFDKKVTDYITFSIFIFSFITAVTYKIDMYLLSESNSAFYELIKNSLGHVILEGIGVSIFIFVIIFLSLNFIKSK